MGILCCYFFKHVEITIVFLLINNTQGFPEQALSVASPVVVGNPLRFSIDTLPSHKLRVRKGRQAVEK